MKIYFNNKALSFKEINLISEENSSYTSLVKFISDWSNDKQIFEFKTSGSTGNPKVIQIKRRQIEASVLMTQKALGLQANDKVLLCLNPEYIASLMMAARCLMLDLDMIIIEPSSNPFDILDDNVKIDFASFVPFQIEKIFLNYQKNKIANIRNILIGGASVSQPLIHQLKALKSNIYQSYGMTETVSHIALMNLKNDSSFQVLDGIKISQDDRGCIAIKGAVTDDDWVQSNDIIELISPHEFSWLGRADYVINSGGIKIFTEELEAFAKEVLREQNFTNTFYFYGIKDDSLGEKVCLAFEGKAPSNAILEILEHSISSEFSKYHIAKEILVVETFDRTRSGKVVRIRK